MEQVLQLCPRALLGGIYGAGLADSSMHGVAEGQRTFHLLPVLRRAPSRPDARLLKEMSKRSFPLFHQASQSTCPELALQQQNPHSGHWHSTSLALCAEVALFNSGGGFSRAATGKWAGTAGLHPDLLQVG